METVVRRSGTATQLALDGLRRAIVAGELRPGARIGQGEFAAVLQVSIAPAREALRILEQEGQVTYHPRRGYFVTALEIADLEEIYALRALLESRAARHTVAGLDDLGMERIKLAARDFVNAVTSDKVAAGLEANRRFHMSVLDSPDHPHTMRIIGQLWDSTEAYRALYYNIERERHSAVEAHDRILDALQTRNATQVVTELAAHRERALTVLREILAPSPNPVVPLGSVSARVASRREGAAQPRKDVATEATQEALLVVRGTVEDEVSEPKFNVGCDPLDDLIGVVGNDES